ncbi:uncharacterized protein DS421_19g660730 [Arachis hypogaea]|uniref:Uncharacterized protein n=1 Tax=Arachis hypogaea TaxID=3818 RepID=A0A6B9VDI9_ARAHY|nr:uncharacterized protein DS421_19g660730 [Arachis hypogaea]
MASDEIEDEREGERGCGTEISEGESNSDETAEDNSDETLGDSPAMKKMTMALMKTTMVTQ